MSTTLDSRGVARAMCRCASVGVACTVLRQRAGYVHRARGWCAQAATANSITAGDELVTLKLVQCVNSAHSSNQRVRLPVAAGDACQFTTADGLAGMIVGGISQSSDDESGFYEWRADRVR